LFRRRALLTARKTSLVWLAWAIVSLWTALDAVHLMQLAFPDRHSPRRALAIIMLAVVNVAMSLGLALFPAAWLSASH
jgi:hypothetical protein